MVLHIAFYCRFQMIYARTLSLLCFFFDISVAGHLVSLKSNCTIRNRAQKKYQHSKNDMQGVQIALSLLYITSHVLIFDLNLCISTTEITWHAPVRIGRMVIPPTSRTSNQI